MPLYSNKYQINIICKSINKVNYIISKKYCISSIVIILKLLKISLEDQMWFPMLILINLQWIIVITGRLQKQDFKFIWKKLNYIVHVGAHATVKVMKLIKIKWKPYAKIVI